MKIEDQSDLNFEAKSNQPRRKKSRNAAQRQSMSQQTAQVIGDKLNGEKFGPNRRMMEAQPQQYQNLNIGDQSLTALTLNSNIDDSSIHNLNQSLNSGSQHPSQIDLRLGKAAQNLIGGGKNERRRLQSRNVQNFMNTSSNQRDADKSKKQTAQQPHGTVSMQSFATPYQNSCDQSQSSFRGQDDAQKLQLIMNLNKAGNMIMGTVPVSRNTHAIHSQMQHHTHQQASQMGLTPAALMTETQSSGENENSSSMLTIGLPSVMGGPSQINLQCDPSQQSSTINLNMNMNFNISNPVAVTNNQQPMTNVLLAQLKNQANQLARQTTKKKKMNRNSGMTSHVSATSADKTSLHIQQLINAQRSNASSLKSLKRLSSNTKAQIKTNQEQINSIVHNLKNLNFNPQTHSKHLTSFTGSEVRIAAPSGHQKSMTKVSGQLAQPTLQSYQTANQNIQRRLIPIKKKVIEGVLAPQQKLIEQKNLLSQQSQQQRRPLTRNQAKKRALTNPHQINMMPSNNRSMADGPGQGEIVQKLNKNQLSQANSCENMQITNRNKSLFVQNQEDLLSQVMVPQIRNLNVISSALQQFKEQKQMQEKKSERQPIHHANFQDSFQSSSKHLTITVDEEQRESDVSLKESVDSTIDKVRGRSRPSTFEASNPYDLEMKDVAKEKLGRLLGDIHYTQGKQDDNEFTFENKQKNIRIQQESEQKQSAIGTSHKIRTRRKENHFIDSYNQYENMEAQDFDFPSNSFSKDESYPDINQESIDLHEVHHARQEVESSQWDTMLELNAPQRLDCENTEIDLDADDLQSLQRIDSNLKQKQRALPKGFGILKSKHQKIDQYIYNQVDQNEQDQLFERFHDDEDASEHQSHLNVIEEPLQTAVINPTSNCSSTNSPHAILGLREKRETPVFDNEQEESDNLKTVIVKTSIQTKSSLLEKGSYMTGGKSSQDFQNNFGNTKTIVKKKKVSYDQAEESSRNQRFGKMFHTISEPRKAHDSSSKKDSLSLEARLKDEEIEVDLPQGETIVSKQRIRQVPVSNTPKGIRNISNSSQKIKSKKSEQSRSLKQLSMEQDPLKKNVYHIFGRQTTESQSSLNVKKSLDKSQPIIKEDRPAGSTQESGNKRNRRLLFKLNEQEKSGGITSAFEEQHMRQKFAPSVDLQNYATAFPTQFHHQPSMSIPIKKNSIIHPGDKRMSVQKDQSRKLRKAAIDMSDINQGVIYDSQGRGRKTATINEDYQSGALLSPSGNPNIQDSQVFSSGQHPYHEDLRSAFHTNNAKRRVMSSHTNHPHHSIEPSHKRNLINSAHQREKEYGDQVQSEQKRIKKPTDIYALRPQTQHLKSRKMPESSKRNSKVLSLMTYQPDNAINGANYTNEERRQFDYEFLASEQQRSRSLEGDEQRQSIRIQKIPSSQNPNEDVSSSSAAMTIKQQPLLKLRAKEVRTLSPPQKNPEQQNGRFGKMLKSWMSQKIKINLKSNSNIKNQLVTLNQHKPSSSLIEKTAQSFTRNRLNREANLSQQHDSHLNRESQEQMFYRGVELRNSRLFQTVHDQTINLNQENGPPTRDNKELMRNIQRGRLQQVVVQGQNENNRIRLAMSQGPTGQEILGLQSNGELERITYRSVERDEEMNEKRAFKERQQQLIGSTSALKRRHTQQHSNLAAWCCIQSKSRNASVVSQEAVKADHSDNTSSGCSVF